MSAADHRLRLASKEEAPSWLQYPESFLRVVDSGLVLFRPWKILDGQTALTRRNGLKDRFPKRDLFPFALRTDSDDVACWESGNLDAVVIIADFSTPDYAQVQEFDSFWTWFRSAIEDFIEFEP